MAGLVTALRGWWTRKQVGQTEDHDQMDFAEMNRPRTWLRRSGTWFANPGDRPVAIFAPWGGPIKIIQPHKLAKLDLMTMHNASELEVFVDGVLTDTVSGARLQQHCVTLVVNTKWTDSIKRLQRACRARQARRSRAATRLAAFVRGSVARRELPCSVCLCYLPRGLLVQACTATDGEEKHMACRECLAAAVHTALASGGSDSPLARCDATGKCGSALRTITVEAALGPSSITSQYRAHRSKAHERETRLLLESPGIPTARLQRWHNLARSEASTIQATSIVLPPSTVWSKEDQGQQPLLDVENLTSTSLRAWISPGTPDRSQFSRTIAPRARLDVPVSVLETLCARARSERCCVVITDCRTGLEICTLPLDGLARKVVIVDGSHAFAKLSKGLYDRAAAAAQRVVRARLLATAQRFCSICQEDVPLSEVQYAALACKHTFCRACLRAYLDHAVKAAVFVLVCPHEGCTHRLDSARINPSLNPEALRERRTKLQAEYLRELQRDSSGSFAKWAAKNTRSCPSCHVLIYRYAGCDHMTCACGTSFQWNARKGLA